MEILKGKLEIEAECVKFDKNSGFPLKAIIAYVLKKASTDKEYYENVVKDSFAATLVYIAEYLLKEIIESEEVMVPDEVVYNTLDRWFMEKEQRTEFISVLKDIKHPQCKNRNPFFESNFLSKDNLEKMNKDFKELPMMEMFIKKYYVEPKTYTPSKSTKKYTPPVTKKPKEPTLFDMLDENKEEVVETMVEEKTANIVEDARTEEVPSAKKSETGPVKDIDAVPMETTSLADVVTGNVPKPTEEEIEAAMQEMQESEDEEIPKEEPSEEVSSEIKEEEDENNSVPAKEEVKEAVQIPKSAAQKSSKSKKQQMEGQFDLFSMF